MLALGTVVTGPGSHPGDADEPGEVGLDARTVAAARRRSSCCSSDSSSRRWLAARLTSADGERGPSRAWLFVLGVALAQGVVGTSKYFTDLPEALVVAHMLGASLFVVALTHGVLALRRRRRPEHPQP